MVKKISSRHSRCGGDLLTRSSDTNISTSDLDVLHQTSLIAVYLWIGAALLIKLSFLLFYHRLDPRKPMRYAVYALLALVLAQNLALIFVAAFSCMASSDGLDDRNCWKASSMQWYVNANGIVIAVLDLGILVTPMFMLHRLAIPKVSCLCQVVVRLVNEYRTRSMQWERSLVWLLCLSLVGLE